VAAVEVEEIEERIEAEILRIQPQRCRFDEIAVGKCFLGIKRTDWVRQERLFIKLPIGMYFTRGGRMINACELDRKFAPAVFNPEDLVIRRS